MTNLEMIEKTQQAIKLMFRRDYESAQALVDECIKEAKIEEMNFAMCELKDLKSLISESEINHKKIIRTERPK